MGTHSGWQVDLQNFKPIDVNIEDVARSLAFTHRFNGHIAHGYTVAEHCIIMSRVLAFAHPCVRLEALLHDAEEAYTGDVILPVKELVPELAVFCARIGAVVMKALWPVCQHKHSIIRDGMYCKSSGIGLLDTSMARVESSLLRPNLTQGPETQMNSLFQAEILAETEKLERPWKVVADSYGHNRELWLMYLYMDEYDKLVREVEAS